MTNKEILAAIIAAKKFGGGSGGGGGDTSAERKDVNFFDYDGRIVESYTAEEALALATLPENPVHDNMVSQGWNYTLAEMQAQVTETGACDVGQMFTTLNGATEVDIELTGNRLSPALGLGINGTVEIDWGDNSARDTVTGTSEETIVSTRHTYAEAGKYTISIFVRSGTAAITYQTGLTDMSSALIWNEENLSQNNYAYRATVKAVRVGTGIKVSRAAFHHLDNMQTVTLPSGLTEIGIDAFYACYALTHLTIPAGVEYGPFCEGCRVLKSVSMPPSLIQMSSRSFMSCQALLGVSIPTACVAFGENNFYECLSLKKLTIPSGVTSLPNSTFYNCRTMQEYHFKQTAPPTLGTNAFRGIPSDCVIYVPSASLSAYQSANNWSNYASYMQGE